MANTPKAEALQDLCPTIKPWISIPTVFGCCAPFVSIRISPPFEQPFDEALNCQAIPSAVQKDGENVPALVPPTVTIAQDD